MSKVKKSLEIPPICPLLYAAFRGKIREAECLGSECAWFDVEKGRCGLVRN